jgi:hypothetical protein
MGLSRHVMGFLHLYQILRNFRFLSECFKYSKDKFYIYIYICPEYHALLQAYAAKWIRSELLWDIRWSVVVILCCIFGTIFFFDFFILKHVQIRCTETSVRSYSQVPRKYPRRAYTSGPVLFLFFFCFAAPK